ncbi:MAG: ribonuclease HI family protein [bacterium]|nr:MAG: ribonuclease HI family protein [bacterium]
MKPLRKLIELLARGSRLGDSWERAGFASRGDAERALRHLAGSLPGEPSPGGDRDSSGVGDSKPAGGVECVVVHVDGASRGNPGPSAVAAVAFLPSGEQLTSRVKRIGKATNNVAEYRAVIEGLVLAGLLGAAHVVVRLDSELVMKQITGEYRIKNEMLRRLAAEVKQCAEPFRSITYEKIPRNENKEADRLANKALAGGAGGSPDD